MFTENFDSHACQGETIQCVIDGFEVTARLEDDYDHCIDDDDGHHPDQRVTGCTDEQYTKLMAARDAYERSEWSYCGVVLSVSREGVTLEEHAASLWGVECNYPGSDNRYLREVANELLDEALVAARATLAKLCAGCQS